MPLFQPIDLISLVTWAFHKVLRVYSIFLNGTIDPGNYFDPMAGLRAMVLSVLFTCTPTASAAEQGLLGLPPLSIPTDNAQTPEKIALGKKLFFDSRLSVDGTVSCATCHDEKKAFADGFPVAEGVRKQKGARNTPTIINAAFSTSQFWDGRRASLEEQAHDPFVNAVEHGLPNHQSVADLVKRDPDYLRLFKNVFDVLPEALTINHVSQSIASYERTLIAGDSAFDRYEYGGDKKALTVEAQRGLEIFREQAGCAGCHTIGKRHALFADHQFHSAGVGMSRVQARLAEITTLAMKVKGESVTELRVTDSATASRLDQTVATDADVSELGRFNVTSQPTDIGRFKTPTLRNIALTAPYMHDGSLKTLDEVVDVELYVRGNEANRPLILTPTEKRNLVEFLKALTSAAYHHAG